ncbi:MAG: 8-oxo-dGTP diphosphatase MutT [Desulfurispora sp.]|uniref:8-oxo-dGTP diphosphatase MutT n=1 Tax=Desulfurispora sp. TaxID=3014275 RepID=UPI0040492916
MPERSTNLINVTAAILINDGKVLIAQRGEGDRLAHRWEFPGGKIEPGETPEACLIREMREEFQVEIGVDGFFGESVYQYEHITVQLLAYLAHLVEGEPRPTAHEAFRWVTVEELAGFDFAPADVPLVEKLRHSGLPG